MCLPGRVASLICYGANANVLFQVRKATHVFARAVGNFDLL